MEELEARWTGERESRDLSKERREREKERVKASVLHGLYFLQESAESEKVLSARPRISLSTIDEWNDDNSLAAHSQLRIRRLQGLQNLQVMILVGAVVARTARRRLGRIKSSSSTTAIPSPLLRRRRPLSTTREEERDDDPLAAVRLTVNGRAVSVPRGLSILEAARSCGVLIPTLCAHPRLPAELLPSPPSSSSP